MEGYQWREDRDWEKVATLIAYLRWSTQPVSPQHILDEIRGRPGADAERQFEAVAGMQDSEAAFDEIVRHQAEKKASSLRTLK